jgi:hypothetical protein
VYEKHPDRPNPGPAAPMRRYQSCFESSVAWAGKLDCTYMDEGPTSWRWPMQTN